MKVQSLQAFGAAHLAVVERPDPQPGPRQVLVRVRAASLNYRDLLMIAGQYNPRQPLPFVPLSDGAGEVVAVGSAVQRVQCGDRVVGLFAQGWLCGPPQREHLRATLGGPLDGALQQLWLLDEDGVARVPGHLDDVAAATLPCAALTAWTSLIGHGQLRPGETVLIQGTGGVSIFALQIAVMCGAKAIVTSSSDAKLARVRALGAWQTINYRSTPQWGKAALAMTDGRGVDHVVEVGGAGTLGQSLQAVRPGGHVSVIGVLSGGGGEVNLLPVLMSSVRVEGVLVGHRDSFEAMVRAFAYAQLQPVVDRVLDWRELPAALEAMQSGAHFGKIVLQVTD